MNQEQIEILVLTIAKGLMVERNRKYPVSFAGDLARMFHVALPAYGSLDAPHHGLITYAGALDLSKSEDRDKLVTMVRRGE